MQRKQKVEIHQQETRSHMLKGKTSTLYSQSWLNVRMVLLLCSLYLLKIDSYSIEESTIWLLFGSLDTDDDLRDDSDVFPLMTSVKLRRKQCFAVCFFPQRVQKPREEAPSYSALHAEAEQVKGYRSECLISRFDHMRLYCSSRHLSTWPSRARHAHKLHVAKGLKHSLNEVNGW